MQYILSMHIYETNSKRDLQESKEKEDDKICAFIHAKQSWYDNNRDYADNF